MGVWYKVYKKFNEYPNSLRGNKQKGKTESEKDSTAHYHLVISLSLQPNSQDPQL